MSTKWGAFHHFSPHLFIEKGNKILYLINKKYLHSKFNFIYWIIEDRLVFKKQVIFYFKKKLDQKVYRHHLGYIGGMQETSARVMMENTPEKAMMIAIKGMLLHTKLGSLRFSSFFMFKIKLLNFVYFAKICSNNETF